MTTTYHQGDCSLFAKHTLGMRPFESGYGCTAGHQSYQVLMWLEQRKRFQLMEGGGGLQADTTGNPAGIPRTLGVCHTVCTGNDRPSAARAVRMGRCPAIHPSPAVSNRRQAKRGLAVWRAISLMVRRVEVLVLNRPFERLLATN